MNLVLQVSLASQGGGAFDEILCLAPIFLSGETVEKRRCLVAEVITMFSRTARSFLFLPSLAGAIHAETSEIANG